MEARITVEPDVPWGGERGATGALDRALAGLTGPTIVELEPGHYFLDTEPYRDPSCGNCEDPAQPVDGTTGLVISGTGITIAGSNPDSVVLHTGAGYGIVFQDCADCVLRGITVTDGVRDPDPRATNGGIVVRSSSVTLQRCRVRDNIGDPILVSEIVVGIAGVVGREGSRIDVLRCRIERNSWDGVALYRDSEATIRGTTIDGVDGVTGADVGGGRGVGIGATWNSRVVVEESLVKRYWKGIGVFLDAHAQIRENVVEEMATWGIAVWGNGEATTAFVEDNVVYETGACGILLDVAGPGGPEGGVSRNILARTTQDPRYDTGDPYCPQQPLARVAVPDGWRVEGNFFHDNRRSGPAQDVELTLDELVRRTMNLYTFEIEPQSATTVSAFMDAYRDAFGPPFR